MEHNKGLLGNELTEIVAIHSSLCVLGTTTVSSSQERPPHFSYACIIRETISKMSSHLKGYCMKEFKAAINSRSTRPRRLTGTTADKNNSHLHCFWFSTGCWPGYVSPPLYWNWSVYKSASSEYGKWENSSMSTIKKTNLTQKESLTTSAWTIH